MVGFLERNPVQATMFQDFHIFERVDGKWGQPSQVYLDAPFLETDLSAYFESLGRLRLRGCLTTTGNAAFRMRSCFVSRNSSASDLASLSSIVLRIDTRHRAT